MFFHTGPFRVITNHIFIADATFPDPILNRQHLPACKKRGSLRYNSRICRKKLLRAESLLYL